MLTFVTGNILESDAEALVNPVNTQGIMGKGLAFQFKKKFPNNYKLYLEKCSNNSFDIGTELVWIEEDNKIVISVFGVFGFWSKFYKKRHAAWV